MFSDFLEAKVSVKARAEKHFTSTALGFGFQIKDNGRRCLSGESEHVEGAGPWMRLYLGESGSLGENVFFRIEPRG